MMTALDDGKVRTFESFFRCLHLDKNKAIPVTGRGDPLDCETSRLPYFLGSRLSDGEVLTLSTGKILDVNFC
jgi:hypothetical protein